jgi:preprotein translocase subunit SecG
MSDIGKALLTIFSAIVTLAIVSVIVSQKSDSAGLVQSLGSTLSNVIKSAVTPVPAASHSVSNGASVSTQNAPQSFWEGLLQQPFF